MPIGKLCPVAVTSANPTPEPMRERIVDVAVELFARQGYQGTSLRHIAERLGVSKAAVYHHFHGTDDIARTVIGRALDVLTEASDRLVVAGTDPGAWQRALPQIIDIALRHRQMLVVLERNEKFFQPPGRASSLRSRTTSICRCRRAMSMIWAGPAARRPGRCRPPPAGRTPR